MEHEFIFEEDLHPEGTIELTRAEIDALNKHNEKVKRELAREIFGEIEKHFLSGTTPLGLCICSIGSGTYIKLKKKYTEGGE